MRDGLERLRHRTLRALSQAYADGQVTTDTLEGRVAEALAAADRPGLAGCLWDLRPAPWWRPRRAGVAPVALILEDDRDSVRVDLGPAPGGIVIGRHSSCAVRVANTSVSRRHAAVSRRGGLCHVRDLGSSNGTTLNGRPVEVAELRRGDRLTLGEVLVRVV
jgi:FHA domain/Domain of unknown function (DUF1707)